MLDAAPKVRLWQIQGSGFEHFRLEYWKGRGVPVANCPGSASAPALAETAMMFTLMLAHRYQCAARNALAGKMYEPRGGELEGKLLGLIGFGASATAFARLARTFGMRIAAVDIRHIEPEEAAAYGLEWWGPPAQLDDMIGMADVLSLHLHLSEATRHILDDRRLRLTPPSAFLVNVARGSLVDEAALVDALREGRLAGAAIDVLADEPFQPDHPLLHTPGVIVTPHTAGNSDGTLARRARFCADNVDRVAMGSTPECLI